ncbi:MAG: acetyl-CoA carboxylase, carboxyltransferase subunit beta [Planctomycetes bacterium]|nr:acetyl-CoA carboxylase, carboxyltransferase subunit beta [Planctomycetota bacterium]
MPIFGWDGLKKLGRREQTPNTEAGTGPATKCDNCGELLIKKTLEENMGVCPHCDHHHRMGAWERINLTIDEGTFVEHDADLASKDVINFRAVKSYQQTLEKARKTSKLLSVMVTGNGLLHGHKVALGVTDPNFAAGSMGSVLGEKFSRLAEYAIAEKAPMIIFSGSGGGARMQEGLYSLMQMAKTSAAVAKLREAGVPYIVVCSCFTMAGVWASWAAIGDICVAEPKCLIGFTGARVIKTTINCELPEGFQTSEFVLEHGQIDMIVHRHDMRDTLGNILNVIQGPVCKEKA